MLTFAGEPLLFPSDLGMNPPDAPHLPMKQWRELDKWLQYHHSLEDMAQFGATEARIASGRQACRSRGEQTKGLGLPVLNWPAPPPPRLNTLYWPTGATRWARGWFVATRGTRDKIVDRVHSDGGNDPGLLKIGDDQDATAIPLSIGMYMLPPRPLSCVNNDDDLWLIPLVDVRYFWQFASVGDIEVTTSTTWTSLFGTLEANLDTTINVLSNVEGAYLNPDPIDFTRRFDNAALLADAAAWSCGRRILRKIDGTVQCQSRSIADTVITANLAKKWRQLAGGVFSSLGGDQPAALVVTFRKMKEYFLQADGALYTKETAATGSQVTVASRKLVIHCAAYADYNTSNLLQNGTALDTLAAQIATDYYGWASKDYDYSFAGILDWTPCGYDDAILWRFGSLCEGQQQAQTRVSTLPGNFFSEVHLASDPSKEVASTAEILVKNTTGSPITADGSGVCEVWTGPTGSESDSGKTVTVYNKTSVALADGKFGSAGFVQGKIYVTPWQN